MTNKNQDPGIAWPKVFAVLSIAAGIAIWVSTLSGENALQASEAPVEETLVLDVFVPKEGCQEIVDQDLHVYPAHIFFDVLCRDAAGTYQGYAAETKRQHLRAGRFTRYNYHFTDGEEMKIEERLVLTPVAAD